MALLLLARIPDRLGLRGGPDRGEAEPPPPPPPVTFPATPPVASSPAAAAAMRAAAAAAGCGDCALKPFPPAAPATPQGDGPEAVMVVLRRWVPSASRARVDLPSAERPKRRRLASSCRACPLA